MAPEVDLELSTVLGQETITSKRVTGLTVRGVNETSEIILPRTYARNVIPARRSQIPRHDTALKWPHLERIASHLMPLDTEAEVGLLIEANCARAIKPHEVILGNDDDPYAKRTALVGELLAKSTHKVRMTAPTMLETMSSATV